MELQVGKRYVRRDGYTTIPITKSGDPLYPFFEEESEFTYTSEGRICIHIEDHPLDLIKEYEEPMKLELGKRYIRKDKQVTGMLQKNVPGSMFVFYDPMFNITYLENGSASSGDAKNCFDIVELYNDTEKVQPSKLKIGIVGPGGAGKDTLANLLAQKIGLTYLKGTSEFASNYVWENWGKYQLTTIEQISTTKPLFDSEEHCWSLRSLYRPEWAYMIDQFNKDDPCALYKVCIEGQDFLTGIRRRREFEAAKPMCDIWIQITKDGLKKDVTYELNADDVDFSISNNGTLIDLDAKVTKLSRMMVNYKS